MIITIIVTFIVALLPMLLIDWLFSPHELILLLVWTIIALPLGTFLAWLDSHPDWGTEGGPKFWS